jgi:hypothetical protein
MVQMRGDEALRTILVRSQAWVAAGQVGDDMTDAEVVQNVVILESGMLQLSSFLHAFRHEIMRRGICLGEHHTTMRQVPREELSR